MTPADLDEDAFAVYPFRRPLVDGDARDEMPPARPALPASTQAPTIAPAPRRSLNPLWLAAPVALVVFIAAVAGSAMVADGDHVQQVLQAQIVPAAAAAAPQPQRRAVPRLRFVPDVVGLDLAPAVERLKQGKFRVGIRFAPGRSGHVLSQKPQAATEVKRPGTVLLVIGRKAKPKPAAPPPVPQTVIVTSVVGLTRATATDALLREGLGVRIYGVRSSRPAGTVVAQWPGGGTRVGVATYVRIDVAVH